MRTGSGVAGVGVARASRVALALGLLSLTACTGDVAPCTEGFAEAAGGARLWYRCVGNGEPILVVHGGPGMDSRYLLPGLERLGERGRAVFYDQRGSGRSQGALDITLLTFDQFVEDIDAVRAAIGAERLTLLGHSYGGLLALEYARRHPERVDRLVLVDSGEPGGQFSEEAALRRAERLAPADGQKLQELAASGVLRSGDTAVFREFYEAAFRATFSDPRRMADLDLTQAEQTAKNAMRIIEGVGRSADFSNGWARLREIAVPTLVIQGRDDLPPLAMAAALVDSLPNAELSVIEAAGHFPWIERPDAFFTALGLWLGRTP